MWFTVTVTQWFQHPIDSHPFRSMSFDTPMPEILLFQNLTLKILSQGSGKVQDYIVSPTSYRFNQPSHSWDTCMAISKFDLKNPRSRSWVKFKVMTWVQCSINSYPFRSMTTGPPILEIRLFQNLTLKIQCQGHSSRSHSGSNILSNGILQSFYVNRPSHSWNI